VETLKHNVLLAEVGAISRVLHPIVGHSLLRILGFSGLDIAQSIVDPCLQKIE
jgi:hypothetical protein